jgi:hypothetical protein
MDSIGQRIKDNWNLLAQLVVWGFGLIKTIVTPPPSAALVCPPDNPNCASSTESWIKYILAFVVVFSLVATWKWSKRRHLSLWLVLTVLVFIGTYALHTYYSRLEYRWICTVDAKEPPILRIKGDTLTREAEYALKNKPRCTDDNPQTQCASLLKCFELKPEQVWYADGIYRHRVYLTAAYFGDVSLFFLGIIFVSQVLYCATQKSARTIFHGYWKDDSCKDDKCLGLRITTTDKQITGHLLNLSNDRTDIEEANIRNDALKFVHGRMRTHYVMSLIDDKKASLLQTGVDQPRSWDLVKLE